MIKSTTKIVKNIPNTETGSWTVCVTNSNGRYIITNCPERQRFTLWKELESGFEKIASADSPLDLDSAIPWYN